MGKKSKNSLTHKKTLTEVVKFSGEVSSDGLYITLDDVQTPIADLFKTFAGEIVDGSVGTKQEDDVE
jgi:hypothetical protein